MRALGFTQDTTPCAATWYHVLRKLDRTLVEATLGAWVESILTALPPATGELEALAIAGKTLRGSREHGTPAAYLLSVLSHRLGRQIENNVHWVRDVTFDEDCSQVRCGSIPQVMAAFRNTAIGSMRWTG